MNCKRLFAPALLAAVGLATVVGSIAIAGPAKETSPAPAPAPGGPPEIPLPPGWTQADMQACMLAGAPGKMHEHLAKGVGTWRGKNTMWMFPGADPMITECTATVTPLMDGRFTKCETIGEMPGMGPFNGLGIYGFDNVSQEFVSTWIDNCGTGIMNGIGELSSDGNTMTWKFAYNCPITKKPAIMREVDKITGPNSRTLEMFSTDPKSGKEFRMLLIEFARQS